MVEFQSKSKDIHQSPDNSGRGGCRVIYNSSPIIKCRSCDIHPQVIEIVGEGTLVCCPKCNYRWEAMSMLRFIHSISPNQRHNTPVGNFILFSKDRYDLEQSLKTLERIINDFFGGRASPS